MHALCSWDLSCPKYVSHVIFCLKEIDQLEQFEIIFKDLGELDDFRNQTAKVWANLELYLIQSRDLINSETIVKKWWNVALQVEHSLICDSNSTTV